MDAKTAAKLGLGAFLAPAAVQEAKSMFPGRCHFVDAQDEQKYRHLLDSLEPDEAQARRKPA